MSRTDLRPDDTSLPERHKVEGVTVCGLLSALRCEIWYRRQSLEVDFVTLDRDDPDLWIWSRSAGRRAVTHEVDEGLLVAGVRLNDPHAS